MEHPDGCSILSCVDKKDAPLKALRRNGFPPRHFLLPSFFKNYAKQREPLVLSVPHLFLMLSLQEIEWPLLPILCHSYTPR